MASSNNNWLGLDNEISTAQIYGDLPSDGNTSSQDWKMINQDMTPKLENFLGHSFCDGGGDNYHGVSGGGGTMGLSMIKHWLRSNPAATESKALSLSMSTGSQSSTAAPLLGAGAEEQNKLQQCAAVEGGVAAEEAAPRKSVETFGQRTSIYRGVTRWTGRYEAHLWDNSCRREGQTRKGRQVYLGGYDKEDKAARSYDLAALKYWGTTTTTNFPMSNYEKEIEEMKHMTRQEYVASLRRKSSGFSRGASMYRGVTRHHQHGRWQARIGRVAGNKDLYLGTFSTQEEAAEAYDVAAIKFRGLNAVTNFEINRYDVKSILESPTLPIGGAAKRLKEAENAEVALEMHRANEANTLNLQLLTDHTHINSVYASGYDHNSNTWPTIAFQQPQPMMSVENYPFALQKPMWCKQEHDSGDVISHGYNFMQTNIVGIDSSGSNSGNNGFGIPMMGIAENGVHHHQNQHGNVGFVGMNDHDHEESLYYHQFQQSSGNWSHIPTAVPTVAGRSNGLSFTGWNNS